MLTERSGRCWSVRKGGSLVPFERAEALLLLSAASGLAEALVNAGDLAMATRLAEAYLRLRPDDNHCPITVLARIETPTRTFSGICLGEHLTVRIDGVSRGIPLRLVRKIAAWAATGWSLTTTSKSRIELIDGSVYKDMTLLDPSLNALTLLGTQSVKFATRRTIIQGHGVGSLEELRHRLEQTLDGHSQAVIQTVGNATFERFFKAA